MPLIENTQKIYKKYDNKSYSSGCSTYMQADESLIVCVIIHDKERGNIGVDKIMEKVFKQKTLPPCVRGHFRGESLKDFDIWLAKYFKPH
jgi:hypothetical protein